MIANKYESAIVVNCRVFLDSYQLHLSFSPMFSRLFVFLSVLLLFGCAYVTEKGIQELTIETPGANDAVCYVYVDGFRYRFYSPQTISIRKTSQDLIVDCYAPGNRRKMVTIPPVMTNMMVGNIMNGIVPGTFWDVASGAAFKFPGVLEVDFRNIPLTPESLPAHNNPDIRQPEDYDLEEFLPGHPRLNSDKDLAPVTLQKRVKSRNRTKFESHYVGTATSKGGKSNPSNIPQLNPSTQGASQPSATDTPAPLYPGE